MTAKSAKEVLIGITALTLFTLIGVMVAGTGDKWANGVLALFIGFAFLQLTFNASLFNKFLSNHPILTGQVPMQVNIA